MEIVLRNIAIKNNTEILLENIDWQMSGKENWLITGNNGGGKNIFIDALLGLNEIILQKEGFFSTSFSVIRSVSFEKAAKLIAEEKENDESEFIEGGVDIGRTVRNYISADMPENEKRGALENHPIVKLFKLAPILDRGLKYLSTGEMRRVLLAQNIAAKPDLLILNEPYEGLDFETREVVKSYLEQTKLRIMLLMDRCTNLPNSITHVLHFEDKKITFCGTLTEFYQVLAKRNALEKEQSENRKEQLKRALMQAQQEGFLQLPQTIRSAIPILIDMHNVNVQWGEKHVLQNVTWQVKNGEHWFIRGPNGSGKTTLLELISGDNPQVFCNKIHLFGKQRGSGETIWELKEKMGIVSYRIHVDYRNFLSLPLLAVVLSGLHDSIGLYQNCGEVEQNLAKSWLRVCGFENQWNISFGNLSYGEQRAVLIARAVVKCPPLLILDEPCHGLDNSSRNRILSLLQLIAESETSTLLHVTHDSDEVLPCEKHILELCPDENPMYKIIIL